MNAYNTYLLDVPFTVLLYWTNDIQWAFCSTAMELFILFHFRNFLVSHFLSYRSPHHRNEVLMVFLCSSPFIGEVAL